MRATSRLLAVLVALAFAANTAALPTDEPIVNGDFTLGVPLAPVGTAGLRSAPTAAYGWTLITNANTQAPASTTSLQPDGLAADLALQVDVSAADRAEYDVAIGQRAASGWTLAQPGTLTLTYSLKVPEGQPALYTQAVVFTTAWSAGVVDGHLVPADGAWHTYTDTYRVVATPGDPGNADWLPVGERLGWTFLALYPEGEQGGQVLVDDVAIDATPGTLAKQ